MTEWEHERFSKLADRAASRRLISDDEWLNLFEGHRHAVTALASSRLTVEERSRLTAAVIKSHGRLHGHRKTRGEADSLSQTVSELIVPFSVAWLVFLGCALLAASSVLADPLTVYAIVPRGLLAGIRESAWGDRGSNTADVSMTLFYTVNNLRAAFVALGLGLLAGVPSFLVVAYNGALLGGVAGYALHEGVFSNLIGWLGPHGVPELTGIMLAGSIGWQLGAAWMRPGIRSRRDALAASARVHLPLMLAAAALIVAAAPLEGFVAPLALPWYADALLASSWVFAIAYLSLRIIKTPGTFSTKESSG